MGGMDRVRSVCTPRRGRWLGVSSAFVAAQRGEGGWVGGGGAAAARRREDFQSEARTGFYRVGGHGVNGGGMMPATPNFLPGCLRVRSGRRRLLRTRRRRLFRRWCVEGTFTGEGDRVSGIIVVASGEASHRVAE